MGDRSNFFIQQHKGAEDTVGEGSWVGIGLYSHWGGTDMQRTAIEAARASVGRLGDPSYFARRVIHKVLVACADPESETGCGLWTTGPDDNEYPLLVVNAHSGLAWLCNDTDFGKDAPASAVHISQFEIAYVDD